MNDSGGTRSLDAVGKALRLLVLIGDQPHGVGVSELSRSSGLPLSSTHRLLSSLVRAGFVTLDTESHQYYIGIRVFELGQRVSRERGFGGMAVPSLEQVVAQTGEAALLGVRVGDEQLFVHTVPSPHPVQIKAEPGTRGPLHCTALGKVLVGFADEPQRAELLERLPLDAYTANTITERQAFIVEIERVREQGFGTALEEHDVGINSIAVPVIDSTGHIVAAVGCAAPASRVGLTELLGFRDPLQAAAQKLAVLLPRYR